MKPRPKVDCFAPGWKPPKEAMDFSRSGEFENVGPKRFIVDGLIAEGEFSVVYGEPASGKGNFVTTLACAAAGAQKFFGRQAGCLSGQEWKPCGVLYIGLERHRQVERRITAYELEHGAPFNLPIAVCSQQFDIRSDDAAELIVATLYEAHSIAHMRLEEGPGVCDFRPDFNLVVVDTLAMALQGGSDSDAGDLGAAILTCKRVIAETDAHVMLIHHSPISGDNRMRGYGSLNAAIDLSIQVDSKRDRRVARVRKNSDGPQHTQDFNFELKSFDVPQWYPDQWGERDLARGIFKTPTSVLVEIDAPASKEAATKPARGDRGGVPTKAEQPVYDALVAMSGPTREEDWRAAYDAVPVEGVSPANHRTRFWRSKDSLLKKGLIRNDDGRWSVTKVASQEVCDVSLCVT